MHSTSLAIFALLWLFHGSFPHPAQAQQGPTSPASETWQDLAASHARLLSQVKWTPVADTLPNRKGGFFEKGKESTRRALLQREVGGPLHRLRHRPAHLFGRRGKPAQRALHGKLHWQSLQRRRLLRQRLLRLHQLRARLRRSRRSAAATAPASARASCWWSPNLPRRSGRRCDLHALTPRRLPAPMSRWSPASLATFPRPHRDQRPRRGKPPAHHCYHRSQCRQLQRASRHQKQAALPRHRPRPWRGATALSRCVSQL
jgi:hypothetical protein